MTIIAIILSLLGMGTICTLLLYFLLSFKQKKISAEVTEMLDNIDKRKKEVSNLDQKVTDALTYLSKMQPLDLALELEEKIKNLKKENEIESVNVTASEEKQKAIQEQLQKLQSTKEKKSSINENISSTKYEVNNNQINAIAASDQEIDFNTLIEELANFVKKTETMESKDKEILQEAGISLAKFQGHLSFLIETYNTTSKRVTGLHTQYQELQQEYQKLLSKSKEDKGSTEN